MSVCDLPDCQHCWDNSPHMEKNTTRIRALKTPHKKSQPEDVARMETCLGTINAAIILRYGEPFAQVHHEWPRSLRRGPLRQCYFNCFQAVADNPRRFVYCEGSACAGGNDYPSLHAWLYEPASGSAYDPTWRDGRNYFGIPFRFTYVAQTFLTQVDQNQGFALIDNWEAGWPLATAVPRSFLHRCCR